MPRPLGQVCSHSPQQHLCENPFCPKNDLITKIIILAFHIFTMGIVWAVYWLERAVDQPLVIGELPQVPAPVRRSPISGTRRHPPVSRVRGLLGPTRPRAALSTVSDVEDEEIAALEQELLEETKNFIQILFEEQRLGESSELRQSLPAFGQDVRKALAIYLQKRRQLEECFQDLRPDTLLRDNPWHKEELQQKAFALLQIAYHISSLTLTNLCKEDAAQRYKKLRDPTLYALLCMMTSVYHHIRCGDLYCRLAGEQTARFYPALLKKLPTPHNWGHEEFEGRNFDHPTFAMKCQVLFCLFCKELREKLEEKEEVIELMRWHPKEFSPTYLADTYLSRPPEMNLP